MQFNSTGRLNERVMMVIRREKMDLVYCCADKFFHHGNIFTLFNLSAKRREIINETQNGEQPLKLIQILINTRNSIE